MQSLWPCFHINFNCISLASSGKVFALLSFTTCLLSDSKANSSTFQLYDNRTSMATSVSVAELWNGVLTPPVASKEKEKVHEMKIQRLPVHKQQYWFLLSHSVQGRKSMSSSSQFSHEISSLGHLIHPVSCARECLVSVRHLLSFPRMTGVRLPVITVTLNYAHLKNKGFYSILWFQCSTFVKVVFTL